MVEAVKIRKAGFSLRIPFETFAYRFRFLAKEVAAPAKEQAKHILTSVKVSGKLWCLGKTKVFMQDSVVSELWPPCKTKPLSLFNFNKLLIASVQEM